MSSINCVSLEVVRRNGKPVSKDMFVSAYKELSSAIQRTTGARDSVYISPEARKMKIYSDEITAEYVQQLMNKIDPSITVMTEEGARRLRMDMALDSFYEMMSLSDNELIKKNMFESYNGGKRENPLHDDDVYLWLDNNRLREKMKNRTMTEKEYDNAEEALDNQKAGKTALNRNTPGTKVILMGKDGIVHGYATKSQIISKAV